MTEAYMNNAQLKLSEFDALSEVSLGPGLTLCRSAYQPIIDAVRTALTVKTASAG